MKTLILTIILSAFCSYNSICQDSILGFYENQTGATERMGEIIEILPHNMFKKFNKVYHETLMADSGMWSINGDTLMLVSQTQKVILKKSTKDLLIDFPFNHDSLSYYLNATTWTRTMAYFEDGNIATVQSWLSISQFFHELIPNGLWVYYYPDGKLKAIGKYRKGKKVGDWFYL